jgi:hypothetical protein
VRAAIDLNAPQANPEQLGAKTVLATIAEKSRQ